MIRPIYWSDDAVVMIDQNALPHEENYLNFRDYRGVADAISDMTVRGAPAIGIAAAMGIALGISNVKEESKGTLTSNFYSICDEFSRTRPTAVNLFWAIERMKSCFERVAKEGGDLEKIQRALKDEALWICEDDIARNMQMGRLGKELIGQGYGILTHCNAGALATGGYGTALGVVRAAHDEGKGIHVYVDETRPVLQGARLTAWEMLKEGIPATLITDGMAGCLMKAGRIDCVIVGADRIAANGDVANKIGTYSVAVLAKEHKIPFYVAAPLSTIDPGTPGGEDIPIEERSGTEVAECNGVRTAPEGMPVYNPAFDVTPGRYVTSIITERGILSEPYGESLRSVMTVTKV